MLQRTLDKNLYTMLSRHLKPSQWLINATNNGTATTMRVPSGPLRGPQQPRTYREKFHNCFSKAHHIHGYSYSIGKGKYQTDRASKLWAQTPGNQVISSTWKQRGEVRPTARTRLSIPSTVPSVGNSGPTSSYESVGCNGGGGEAGDRRHDGRHENNQTRKRCRGKYRAHLGVTHAQVEFWSSSHAGLLNKQLPL